MSAWKWWVGFDGEVENEGIYTGGCFSTREQAIEAGKRELPDIDGHRFFHIIEAKSDGEPVEGEEFHPFSESRNHEIIGVTLQ